MDYFLKHINPMTATLKTELMNGGKAINLLAKASEKFDISVLLNAISFCGSELLVCVLATVFLLSVPKTCIPQNNMEH